SPSMQGVHMRPPLSVRIRRSLVGAVATVLSVAVLPAAGGAQTAAVDAPTVVATKKVAPGLYELTVSASTGEVYVASVGRRSDESSKPGIYVLDPKTLEVTRT